jgi:hypothetical protein
MPGLIAAALNGNPGGQSLFASQAIEIWPGEKAQVLHRDAGPSANAFRFPQSARRTSSSTRASR